MNRSTKFRGSLLSFSSQYQCYKLTRRLATYLLMLSVVSFGGCFCRLLFIGGVGLSCIAQMLKQRLVVCLWKRYPQSMWRRIKAIAHHDLRSVRCLLECFPVCP